MSLNSTMIRIFWENFLIRVFVDNLTLDKYWRCHQKSERSFFVRGRQFHICARCTGIITGYFFSPLMYFAGSGKILLLFALCSSLMAVDGFTQLFGWRESSNILRLVTGLGFGLTFPPFLVVCIIYLLGTGEI